MTINAYLFIMPGDAFVVGLKHIQLKITVNIKLSYWQCEPKGATFSNFTLHTDLPAMPFYDFFRQIKANAEPANGLGSGRFDPVIAVKNPGPVLRRYTHALILHTDPRLSVYGNTDHLYGGAGW